MLRGLKQPRECSVGIDQNGEMLNNSRTNKILLAEDNDDSRLMLRLFLESLDYRVVEAKNGEEAVRFAQQNKPDLILMDLNMPQIDGVTAAIVIRQLKQLSDVPILATSADGGRGIDLFMNIKSLGKGYVGYIAKPIGLDNLAEQISLVLKRAEKAA